MAKAALHVNAQKSFSKEQSNENERRWTKEQYKRKNKETGNHYDWSRKGLNFEIRRGADGNPSLFPLGSSETSLDQRYRMRLEELGFKAYKQDARNNPNTCVDAVFSGDHDRMAELAFGEQQVDFELKDEKGNGHVTRCKDIEQWALDVYQFACDKWKEENIIGMEVHLDEMTPHAHLLFIPVEKKKQRGRLKKGAERKEKETVSYCGVFGDTKYARSQYVKSLHTEFHEKVGCKYGLERGDDLATLSEEERAERVHKNKHQLEAERKSKERVEQNNALAAALDNDIAYKKNNLDNLKRQADIEKKALDNLKMTQESISSSVESGKKELNRIQRHINENASIVAEIDSFKKIVGSPLPPKPPTNASEDQWRQYYDSIPTPPAYILGRDNIHIAKNNKTNAFEITADIFGMRSVKTLPFNIRNHFMAGLIDKVKAAVCAFYDDIRNKMASSKLCQMMGINIDPRQNNLSQGRTIS